MAISINDCIHKCSSNLDIGLDRSCSDNIILLIEIRDSAIHFLNNDKLLSKKVYEIGTASLKNYMTLIREWFNYDLTRYNFFLMPLSFFHEFESIESFSLHPKNQQVDNLLQYILEKEVSNSLNTEKDFFVSLNLKTTLVRSNSVEAIPVEFISNPDDPEAIKITLSEENIFQRYPYTYKELTKKLRDRYVDFKEDQSYHTLRNQLVGNKKFCHQRVLYQDNPKSPRTKLFSSEIFKEFDKHYTKKR